MRTSLEKGAKPAGALAPTPASLGPAWELGLDAPTPETLRLHLAGSWRLRDRLPATDAVERALTGSGSVRRIVFEAREVRAWDTGLVAFVMKVVQHAEGAKIAVDREALPAGVNRLIALARAVPEEQTGPLTAPPSWLARLGLAFLGLGAATLAVIRFVGETTLTFARFVRGQATFRGVDFLSVIHECGPRALPIVTLISALVGLILAFMGAVQLKNFGAQVYVADLVAIAATREMGCLMTGIIMAGRTSAAFAAQLGTMRVNEEIDALVTLGIPPMEFLVLPRMLALILMMPILTVYSDLLAILGGGVVGEAMSGAGDGPRELWLSTAEESATHVVISVRDSGPGLDVETLDRLFDAFYTTKPEGLGMGLTISRSIVESHGGRLWATANVPRGAVFQFSLPTGRETPDGPGPLHTRP